MPPVTRSLLSAFGTACAAALFAAGAAAQDVAPPPGAPASSVAAAADAPLASLPYTPVLDPGSMDTRVDACEDFYAYACGGWIAKNPIPADQSAWDVYTKMMQDNHRLLWGILDRYAGETRGRTPAQQKIGDAFAACMDEREVESLGARPMQPLLALVQGMRSKRDLPVVLARLHLETGDGMFFGFTSNPDYADSSRVIAFADAGGLGLPDRDYYVKTDDKSKTLREQYLAHVARMFGLMGDDADVARHEADVVMAIETALARASLTRVEQRDPQKLFHKGDARALQALTPSFDWKPYLAGLRIPGTDQFNITEPRFYRGLDAQLRTHSLDDLKTYLRWHVVSASAPFLAKAFVDENFAFFSHTLLGTPQLAPRWQRCVTLVDSQLGDALGQEFVRQTFSPGLKARTLHITRQVEDAMDGEIRNLDWMSDTTKKHALEKLHAIVNKIGYPDRWRDYAGYVVERDDLLGNVERGNAFEMHHRLDRIGKPFDRSEWGMTPTTVNAEYDPQTNAINFPAAVLQPPLFDARLDDAPNYGNTGGTIGHELTHGFDDEGRQYDGAGNLRNWWTRQDAAQFGKQTKCLTDQYAQYVIVDDIHINSQLTLGEDLADFGGLVLALIAWKAELATHPEPPAGADGLAPEQRFFVGYAQWACGSMRPEQSRALALVDPHSPPKYRVNGLVANFPEFQKAFACKTGQPMAPATRCHVW